MQLLIVALITALAFGAMTTYLIAQFLSGDVLLKGARHGRYAYLGEDAGEASPQPARRHALVQTRQVRDVQ